MFHRYRHEKLLVPSEMDAGLCGISKKSIIYKKKKSYTNKKRQKFTVPNKLNVTHLSSRPATTLKNSSFYDDVVGVRK